MSALPGSTCRWRFKLAIIVFWLCGRISVPSANLQPGATDEPNDEQRYWRRAHQIEDQYLKSADDRIRAAREEVLRELAETKADADAFQSQVLAEQDGPPPVVKPSWFEGKGDYIVLSTVGALVTTLLGSVFARHRREAEIRALSGGYLSDGTDVANYTLPDWFASASKPTMEPWIEQAVGIEANPSSKQPAVNGVETRFFTEAPQILFNVSETLRALAAEQDAARRDQFLAELSSLLSALSEKTNLWELRPAWQIASALQMLVERIAKKPRDATPSVMRTIASALDVLHKVCVPGVRPNLLIDPPVRIMAVDDEPLCRRALQFALEKAKLTADIAQTGEEAIQLALNRAYDLVLMDIQMPGIDGFAACQRIHETRKNSRVPVVFVTVLSDFNTRAKSRLEGGVDLMAKPYLILELTVKAMTYIVKDRLQIASGESTELVPRIASPILQLHLGAENQTLPARGPSASEPELSIDEIIDSGSTGLQGNFFETTPKYLARTRKLVEELRRAPESSNAERIAGALYVRVHRFAELAAANSLPVTAHVSSTLEALLKRLYNKPNAITVSTINTASHALKLLTSLCSSAAEASLAGYPNPRCLVVEDEALSRRAVVGALQLAFEKPASAGDGAQALDLATKNHYDVIFSDIQMPEMDGFEFCAAVRSGGLNQHTPVIFITALRDTAAQAGALECGGNDFISKPFLPIEITVKALTFAVESRLRRRSAAAAHSASDAKEPTKPLVMAA